jgi:hypothetical protein
MLMTDVFTRLNDEQFRKEWVPELLDQLCVREEDYLSINQLAKALADVRTRYEMMRHVPREKTTTLTKAQKRVIRRLRGIISQADLAKCFGTSQPLISRLQRD